MEYWIRRWGAGASAKKGRRARKWQHTKFNFKSAFIFHIVCWFLSLSHLLFPFGTLFVHCMYTFFFSHFSSPLTPASSPSFTLGAYFFVFFTPIAPLLKKNRTSRSTFDPLASHLHKATSYVYTHSHIDYPLHRSGPLEICRQLKFFRTMPSF